LPPLESAVLTIGRFEAGTASNIIPEEAVLEGTLRTLRPEVREKIVRRLQQMVKGVDLSHNVVATLQIVPGYPVLVNDVRLVKHARDIAETVLGAGHVHWLQPRMGAEDFAYFCERWGGTMVGLGCHDPEQGMQYGLHSPHFEFDETVLKVGTQLFGNILARYPESLPVRPDLGP
jgi:amidohydrolase